MKKLLLFTVCALMALYSNAQLLNTDYYGFETGIGTWSPQHSTWSFDETTFAGTHGGVAKFSSIADYTVDQKLRSVTDASGTASDNTIILNSGSSYLFKIKVYAEAGSTISTLNTQITTPTINILWDLPLDADNQGKWVELEQMVTVSSATSASSRLFIKVPANDGAGTIYIDDFNVEEVLPTSVQFNITQDVASNGTPNVIIDDVQYKADQVVSETVSTTDGPIDLLHGTYDYVITSNGSDIYYGSLTLANGEEKVVDVTMPVAQSGQFVFAYTDGGVKSTQKAITVKDDQNRTVAIGKTNSGAGKFWASGLIAGTYTYELDGITGTFYCGGRNRSFNIEKSASSINMGLFNTTNGNIIDATVVLSDGSTDFNGTASASGDVSFGADLFVNGTAGTSYSYTITAPGYITKTGSFTTVADVVDFYEIELESDGSTAIGDVNESLVKVYPNPASDLINVECSVQSQVNIFNVTGQLILQKMAEGGVAPINISNLQSGYYFVQISNKDYTEVVKVQVY